MSNEIELTPEAIETAMKFLSVPWLTRKELAALNAARRQASTDEAMLHEDEAGRCRSTIIQLAHLRSETARLVAELARVEKERDKAERTHAQQLRWQGDEWQFTLDAMTTRAKSAEAESDESQRQRNDATFKLDRTEGAATANERNWCKALVYAGLSPEQIRDVTAFILHERPQIIRELMKAIDGPDPTHEANKKSAVALTPPGDAGKGGG